MFWIVTEFLIGVSFAVFVTHFIPVREHKTSIASTIYIHIFYFLFPLFCLFLTEYPWNDKLWDLSFLHVFLNYIILLCIMSIFCFLFPRRDWGICLMIVFSGFVGLANTEVIIFRFYPIAPVDLLSIRTAAAVSDGYQIFFNKNIGLTIFFGCLLLLVVGIHKNFFKRNPIRLKKYLLRLLFALSVLCSFSFWVAKTDFYSTYELKNYEWDPARTYKENGFFLSFCAQIHDMIPQKPDGYKKQTALDIVEAGAAEFDKTYNYEACETSNAPVVLTIMNESFTDYSMIGDFSANDEYLSFFHSLQEDEGTLEYGYCYTSTFGGGTYKSEFEYLTGNSMANISGTLPYMMFDFYHMDSVVAGFNQNNYLSVASHPSFPTNWRRKFVYDGMGFSKFLDLDDFPATDTIKSIRGYMSDQEDYNRLVKEIKDTDEALFLFNVTIQNHGGYSSDELEHYDVDLPEPYNQYDDVKVFTALMNKSDLALEELISQLKKLNRPVILCFYGDHQPSLNEEFTTALLESQKDTASNSAEFVQRRYITPYLIWTNNMNYDVTYGAPSLNNGYNIITPTYLGAMSRYYAGCELTSYDKYLIQLRNKLPVLNINGCYTKETGFLSTDEIAAFDDGDLKTILKDYSYVEYQRIYNN